MEYLGPIIIIVLCYLLEGFFSGSEIALISLDKIKLKHQVETGNFKAKLLYKMLQTPGKLLSTTLLGTNLCTIIGASLGTFLVIKRFGPRYDFLALLFVLPLTLFMGEIIPKGIYQQNANKLATRIIYPLRFFYLLFYPLVFLFNRLAQFIFKLSKIKPPSSFFISKEEAKLLLQMSGKKSDLKPGEKELVHRIIDFSKISVREIMIPLVEVVAINEKMTIAEAVAIITKTGHTRLPVYKERVDNLTGILHSFDIFEAKNGDEEIVPYMKKIIFVPEILSIDKLLINMQKKKHSMVGVVDEYGGVVGVITLEDILEEIVGEIEDEYDQRCPLYKKLEDNTYLIDARIEIDQLKEELNIKIPQGDYETLGGFLLSLSPKIPSSGEEFQFKRIKFKIIEVTDRSIEKVWVKILGN